MQGLLRLLLFTSIALVIACCSFAANKRETPNDGVLDGTWRADVSESQLLILSIEKSKLELTAVSDGKKQPSWIGKMSITKDLPNQNMDWVELHCGGMKLPDNRCLFRLRGDTLLVIGGGPNQRPTRFDSGPGSDPKTLVFFRIDPKIDEAKHIKN